MSEDIDITDILRVTRATLKYERLAKDIADIKAENKAQRAELKRQAEQLKRVSDITMVVMETTRAIQIVQQLWALQWAAYPLTAALGVFMLGAIAGLDVYHASKLMGGN